MPASAQTVAPPTDATGQPVPAAPPRPQTQPPLDFSSLPPAIAASLAKLAGAKPPEPRPPVEAKTGTDGGGGA